jgi:hypothetical protein
MPNLITDHACEPWTYSNGVTTCFCVDPPHLRMCDRPPQEHAGVHPQPWAEETICNPDAGGCGRSFPHEDDWKAHYALDHEGVQIDDATKR